MPRSFGAMHDDYLDHDLYHNVADEIEEPIAGQDMDCQICGGRLIWEEEPPDPGDREMPPSPGGAGWACDSCDAAQEATEADFARREELRVNRYLLALREIGAGNREGETFEHFHDRARRMAQEVLTA